MRSTAATMHQWATLPRSVSTPVARRQALDTTSAAGLRVATTRAKRDAQSGRFDASNCPL